MPYNNAVEISMLIWSISLHKIVTVTKIGKSNQAIAISMSIILLFHVSWIVTCCILICWKSSNNWIIWLLRGKISIRKRVTRIPVEIMIPKYMMSSKGDPLRAKVIWRHSKNPKLCLDMIIYKGIMYDAYPSNWTATVKTRYFPVGISWNPHTFSDDFLIGNRPRICKTLRIGQKYWK